MSFRALVSTCRLLQAALPTRLTAVNFISERCVSDYSDVRRTAKLEKLLRRDHVKRWSKDQLRGQTAAVETLKFNEAALRKRVTRAVGKLVRRIVYSDESLCKLVEISDIRVPISLTEVLISWQFREYLGSRGSVQTVSGLTNSQVKLQIEEQLKAKAAEIHSILNGTVNDDGRTDTNVHESNDEMAFETEPVDSATIRLDKLNKVSFVYRNPLERVMLMERTFEALKQSQGDFKNVNVSVSGENALRTESEPRSHNVYELDRDSLVRELERERKKQAAKAGLRRDGESAPSQEPALAEPPDEARQRVRSALRHSNAAAGSRDRFERAACRKAARSLLGDADRVRFGELERFDSIAADEKDTSNVLADDEFDEVRHRSDYSQHALKQPVKPTDH